MKCLEKDKICLHTLDIDQAIRYVKSFAIDWRYSKEFYSLLDDYFLIRQCHIVQNRIQTITEQCFYQRLHGKNYTQVLKEIECMIQPLWIEIQRLRESIEC